MARVRIFSTHSVERFARSASVFFIAAAFVCAAVAPPALAIRDAEDHDVETLRNGFDEAEGDALTTLALADESLRDAVLDASVHPDALASLSAIQERSSREFRSRLDGEERATQQDVWELSRYPELVDELVLGGRPTRGAVDDIVEGHPKRIQEIARGLALHHFSLVRDIATIREEAERENRLALASLPLSTQASFEALIERPDLLSAMLREPAVPARLARMVREDSWNARTTLDREHARLTDEREQELDDWRETIENDPEAERELRESAEQFAEDEGYEDPDDYADDYADYDADDHDRVETRTEVHHIYHHPYPWWFGPPHWQVGWHWYPHHTHWGFHVSIGGGLLIHSLPSPVFSYWHYRRPPSHRHHYRHLHGHWSRYGSRHYLHRDYKHRVHRKKRHSYHHRRHGVHGGHRAKRYERRGDHHERRRYDSTNKFFRHDTVKHKVKRRSQRDGPLHRVVRDEPRKREKERSRRADRRRVAKRDDRSASPRDRIREREPSRSDRKRGGRTHSTTRRDRKQEKTHTTVARKRSNDGERNRLTTSKRKSSSKKKSASTSRRRSSSKFGNTTRSKKMSSSSKSRKSNKFTRPSGRSSSSKKSNSRFSSQSRKKKSSKKINSKTSSKKRKTSSRKSSSSKSKKSSKSRKKKGGGSSNKFFARR